MGWVYAMAPGTDEDGWEFDLVKIGYTERPVSKRRRELEHACGRSLRVIACIPGTRTHERRVHDYLAEYRTRGEWFRYERRVEEFIGFMEGGMGSTDPAYTYLSRLFPFVCSAWEMSA